jgi:hypothetical protein
MKNPNWMWSCKKPCDLYVFYAQIIFLITRVKQLRKPFVALNLCFNVFKSFIRVEVIRLKKITWPFQYSHTINQYYEIAIFERFYSYLSIWHLDFPLHLFIFTTKHPLIPLFLFLFTPPTLSTYFHCPRPVMGDVLTTKGTKNFLHLKGIICFHKKTLKLKKNKKLTRWEL